MVGFRYQKGRRSCFYVTLETGGSGGQQCRDCLAAVHLLCRSSPADLAGKIGKLIAFQFLDAGAELAHQKGSGRPRSWCDRSGGFAGVDQENSVPVSEIASPAACQRDVEPRQPLPKTTSRH